MSDAGPGPGADLRAAREALRVSIREVADALNLSPHVIESLEADDYDALPPSVFTRGYLRSYARLLELPPDELLARYPEVTEEVEVVETAVPVREPLVSGNSQLLLAAAAALAGLLLLGLLWWWLGGEESPAGPAPEPPGRVDVHPAGQPAGAGPDRGNAAGREAAPDVAAPEARPAAAGSDEVPVVAPPAAGMATDPAPSGPAGTLPEELPEEQPEEQDPDAAGGLPAATGVEAPGLRERRLTEFGDDRMVFVFSQDCWVEVKTLGGENLYSDLNRAGRTLVLTGQGPFRVLLGYAPGVSLAFNGEPVPLARYSRNNVATLVLGR